jgi:hypothetical protein
MVDGGYKSHVTIIHLKTASAVCESSLARGKELRGGRDDQTKRST